MVRSLFALLFILIWTEGVLAKTSSDFNSDGVTDFADYVLFAGHVGSAQGEPGFDSRFDLDNNGTIDLGDFVLFAEVFGQGEFISKKALTPEELEGLAKAYLENENYKAAAEKYEAFLESAKLPEDKVRGLKELGITYIAMDSLDKASEQFEKALADYGSTTKKEIKHHLTSSLIGLGQVYFLKGEEAQAVFHWSQIKSYQPTVSTKE
ncbi:MAG: hypothetical protein OXH06_00310 [Gemmatimonadetes bacterium]|nr:hypothetical protein [Gemmatimonadota bacterium]